MSFHWGSAGSEEEAGAALNTKSTQEATQKHKAT